MKSWENLLEKEIALTRILRRALIILVDEKITLVKKNLNINQTKERNNNSNRRKTSDKSDDQLECISEKWEALSYYLEKAK